MSTEELTALVTKAKLVLRITTDAFDSEITDIVQAGVADLGTRGVLVGSNISDPLVIRALMTYVRLMFGEPENPERLQASYNEQKAQLMTTSNYTNWLQD